IQGIRRTRTFRDICKLYIHRRRKQPANQGALWSRIGLVSRMHNSHPAVYLLPAANQRGEDAEGRDTGADDKGSVEGGSKGVLQSNKYALASWRNAEISRQDCTRDRAAQASKDRSGQCYTDALAHHPARGKKAGCNSLAASRGGAHQGAVIGRLEERLTNPCDHQAPDDIRDRTVRV